ncbi:NO-insensitive guanylyl cyclase III [Chlorella sorokiniana]|uniref:NO-insensitive guanylyl cyclase III n=1 Tax=Chlorella sorokiniana TaxID=3076 RepID=A0A2P6TV58_CHLSO|nr:NO-insensitive guanylyl cyclase III [Chlorella sorokiniana]|eukprot:PRW57941.1 NO-insensitive guanylyl cyclase III [Chlorella sorokiniana]
MRADGAPMYEDIHDSATVLVGRFRNENALCSLAPKLHFAWLHPFYVVLDGMANQHRVFKLHGGAQGFLLATNVAEPDADHAATMFAFAQQLMRVAQLIRVPGQAPLDLALAMDSGPLASGLLGKTSLTYQVVGRAFEVARELAGGQADACLMVADGLRRALPEEAAEALIPMGGVQLRCSPEAAVFVYTVPPCTTPPPHNTAPATPPLAAALPDRACLAPMVPKLMPPVAGPANQAGSSNSCCACGCGNVHADALLARAAGLKDGSAA